MAGYFRTTKLDQAMSDRRLKLENERQMLLNKTIQWLDEYGEKYGINRAYIFGSVTRTGKFHEQSDIDVAVEQINSEDFFSVIGLVAEALGREVDIIMLDKCHFAERIRERGILWTKIHS
ncbi:MAG: nucleotidyltransferase domain-containing protein [Gomphosphaeria aponina SAG 52.96 = DSM 107014]|uniref:Nucleotidyltransferase domain-containing protein n=1 Tax=Gomphosphaeria aponina SAG 52.96 = DSM 107014 TaxID=1521640 RepID=A0A941GWK4_9CHRO|nr:nucleotidyltransferase domain-containing protein [Gomphosphaeria aponina SAG 52.96 = DSM 107014]